MRPASLLLVLLVVAATIPAGVAVGEVQLYHPGDVYGKVYLNGILLDLAWDPAGERVAVALGVSHELRLYNSEGALLWALNTGKGPGPLDWSPDGQLIAVGVADEMWVVASNTRALLFKKQYDYLVTDVAWSPDGELLAVATAGGDVYIYDKSGALRYALAHFNPPVTALAWSPDGERLIVGDGGGHVYSVGRGRPLSDVLEVIVNGVPKGFAFRPGGGGELVIATNSTLYKARLLVNGSIALEYSISYGAASAPSWSPDGTTIAVPHEREIGFFDANLNPVAFVAQPEVYSIYYVSWNPARYSVLVAGGRNIATSASSFYYIYTGSYYVLQAQPPVTAFCYAGTCSSRLELDAWNKTISVEMKVVLDVFGDGVENATIGVNLTGEPMRVYTINGAEAITGTVGPLTVPGDRSLIIVLRDEQANVTLEYVNGSKHVLESLGAIVPPGQYTVKVTLPEPEDWLGPGWVLERKTEVYAARGLGVVLDFRGFNIEAVTARLELDVEPGTLVTLRYTNDTVQAIAAEGRVAYTVPAGSYVIELSLPVGENIIVESSEVLVKRVPAKLKAGDTLTLAFHYGDVLGWIDFNLPPRVRVQVTPPWQAAPAWAKEYPEGGRDSILAQPGTYLVEATLAPPEGWLGPEPPSFAANVTVEAGRHAEVNLYHDVRVQSWLDLLSKSGTVAIISPPGLKVKILEGEKETATLDSGNLTVILPPGNYTFQLIDPARNLLLSEAKLEITGSGNYTVKLEKPVEQTQQQAPPPPPATSEGRGRKLAIVAVAAIVPLALGAAAILVLRRRSASRQAGGEVVW